MKTIYFIRHGQTKYNVEGRFVGSTDLPLSEDGRKQIFNKWDGMQAHIDRDIIFTSPMKRCVETTGIIFPYDSFEVLKNMREMNFGMFEGKTHDELEYLEEYDVTFSFLDILKQPIPGIEPYVIHTNSTLSDPKDEIISYVKSVLPTSNYSVDSYLQNHEADQYQNFYFPYNIASDLSLFVVLAEPVSFSFDFVNTDLVEIRESINIDTYQNKYLGEPVYINEETSTYYLYGNDTGLSISQYEFKGAYLTKNGVDDLDTRYNLPIYAPNTSYNSEENHINLVFKSI